MSSQTNCEKVDYLVFGDGFGGAMTTNRLLEEFPEASVMQISNHRLYPPSSRSAGALASTFGARAGLSERGDLNLEAYQCFEKTFGHWNFDQGLSKVSMMFIEPESFLHLCSSSQKEILGKFYSKEQYLRIARSFKDRWSMKVAEKKLGFNIVKEDAFLVRPDLFLHSLRPENIRNSFQSFNIDHLHDFSNDQVHFQVGKQNYSVNFKRAFVFGGAYVYEHSKLIQIIQSNSASFSRSKKVVFGSYGTIPSKALNDSLGKIESLLDENNVCVLNILGINVIFDGRGLTFGATTQNSGAFNLDRTQFESMRSIVQVLCEILQIHLG